MLLILRVVVQPDPIAVGESASWLQHAVNISEQLHLVNGVAKCADLIGSIKGLIRKGQRVIETAIMELQLRAKQTAFRSKLFSAIKLALVVVEAGHLCTGVGRHFVGDAPGATAQVQDVATDADIELVTHQLLEQNLVRGVAGFGVNDRRNVHLLNGTKSAKMVENLVPIDDAVFIFLAGDLLFAHYLMRVEVRIYVFLRHVVQGPKLLDEFRGPSPESQSLGTGPVELCHLHRRFLFRLCGGNGGWHRRAARHCRRRCRQHGLRAQRPRGALCVEEGVPDRR
mmetsp:Transcript_705/g.1946  ORF Transcript_705/g.1946 Transcript_705/m.1946 type:complete len:283 (-) Transcript_705:13-861(-)